MLSTDTTANIFFNYTGKDPDEEPAVKYHATFVMYCDEDKGWLREHTVRLANSQNRLRLTCETCGRTREFDLKEL